MFKKMIAATFLLSLSASAFAGDMAHMRCRSTDGKAHSISINLPERYLMIDGQEFKLKHHEKQNGIISMFYLDKMRNDAAAIISYPNRPIQYMISPNGTDDVEQGICG